jgi:hypothetical protein
MVVVLVFVLASGLKAPPGPHEEKMIAQRVATDRSSNNGMGHLFLRT